MAAPEALLVMERSGKAPPGSEGQARALVGHGTWAVSATLVDALGAALMSALLTRLLGVRSMGQFGYAQTLAALILTVTGLGMPALVAQKVAWAAGRREPPDRILLVCAWVLSRVGWPGAALVVASFAYLSGGWDELGILAAGLGAAMGVALLGLAISVSRSLGRFREAFATAAKVRAASLIAVVVVAGAGGRVGQLLGLYALIQASGAISLLLQCMPPKRWRGSWRPQGSEWKWIREALPWGLIIMLEASMFRIDTLFVEWLAGGLETGRYVIAYTVYSMPMLLSYSVVTAFYPWFTRAYSAGVGVKRTTEALTMLLAVYGVLAALGLWVLGPWILKLVFGADSAEADPVVRILSLALPAAGLARLGLAALKGAGLTRAAVIAPGSALAVAVVGNWAFTGSGGARAAAWVNLATELALLLVVAVLGGLGSAVRKADR